MYILLYINNYRLSIIHAMTPNPSFQRTPLANAHGCASLARASHPWSRLA